MKPIIRKAVQEDAPAITDVHVSTWKSIYEGLIEKSYLDSLDVNARLEKWETLLRHTGLDSMIFVAEDDGKVVGFAHIGMHDAADGAAELYSIYLLPGYHGRGVGSALFRACKQEIESHERKKFFCWVFKSYIPGHEFYKHMGGRLISRSEKQLIIDHVAYPIVSYEWDV